MSTLGVGTFFLALAAFIFSFSSYVVLCKCWGKIDATLRAVRALHGRFGNGLSSLPHDHGDSRAGASRNRAASGWYGLWP